MTRTNQEIVEMVTAKVGGESALARALGIKVQSVQKWKKIPAERMPAVEAITGISREKLRPDLFMVHESRRTLVEFKEPRSAGSKKKRR
jgi:DNA-binding transcriptional regulator YdaS (Cro superfamily)